MLAQPDFLPRRLRTNLATFALDTSFPRRKWQDRSDRMTGCGCHHLQVLDRPSPPHQKFPCQQQPYHVAAARFLTDRVIVGFDARGVVPMHKQCSDQPIAELCLKPRHRSRDVADIEILGINGDYQFSNLLWLDGQFVTQDGQCF